MSNKDPLGRQPHRAIDEFMRRERERTDLITRALGPAYNLQKQMNALNSPLGQFAALQKSGVYGEIGRTMKLQEDQFNNLKNLMTPNWASAIQGSALAVGRHGDAINKQLLLLTKSLDTALLGTAKILQRQNSVLAAAMAGSKWQDQFKAIADQLSPSLMAFRGTAERMAMMDLLPLRASITHLQSGVIHTAVQQAIEAQQIIEAFAQVDTPEEGAMLFAAFITLVAALLGHFKGNTVEELRKLGLFGIIGIIAVFISFFPSDPPQGQTPEQQQEFAEMHSQINTLQSQLHDLQKAEDALNDAYVSELPRAELVRKSNIRRNPAKGAPKILVAESGTLVAIARSEGRWKLVVFRDPLTDQLSQGWVYGTSVAVFDPTVG